MQGEITGNDFFDIVEPVMGVAMDEYVEEVEDNIDMLEDEGLLILPI